MKVIALSALLLSSTILLANSSDLSCQKIPVSIFYAEYTDASSNQKYVYFDGVDTVDITPPKSASESKSLELISSGFSNKPSFANGGKKISFPAPASSSETVTSYLHALGELPVSIYYAGYTDTTGAQKYVYFDGTDILDITPPKTTDGSKTINIITDQFTSLPTLEENTDCVYNPAFDGWYDTNYHSCIPGADILLNFSSLKGESCDGITNKAPTANAGADQTVTEGQTVTLSAAASTDSDGSITSYSWKEGSTVLSTASSFSKSNFSVGIHTITLTVTDNDGATASDEVLVRVNTTSTTGGSSTVTVVQNSDSPYTLLAWNDLGMHCMDGKDFSVFSILPPYNNLNAQLIKKDGTSDKHIVSGVTLTYSAAPSLDNKYNTTSMYNSYNQLKTNFWDYVSSLFNTTLPDDTGLTGNMTPNFVEKALSYNAEQNWWEATGLPITPYNDDGTKNYYPMVYVTAKDASGAVLATTQVVLPVSDEMDCKACHSSTSNYSQAQPVAGWENDIDAEKDFKYNILRLHDQKFPTAVSNHQAELQAAGYTNYNDAGLYASAKDGNPVLCATCHATNALATSGVSGTKPLTEALHSSHADALDPQTNMALGDSSNRGSCYRCHPGATTKCLRGAMGNAVDSNGNAIMQCQSCHGSMNAVGQHGRNGWLQEPNCQSCHQNGQRYTSAVTDVMSGTLRAAADTRFATNPNTPASGISLYRFSTGHGDMQCSACHGATHAIYPSSHEEDNLQSIATQGHSGTVAECTACHTTTPRTTTGGPHGMHTVGQDWISSHEDAAERDSTQCAACHGSDYRGSALSKTFSARSFRVEGRTKTYTASQEVTCYDCHNGPRGD